MPALAPRARNTRPKRDSRRMPGGFAWYSVLENFSVSYFVHSDWSMCWKCWVGKRIERINERSEERCAFIARLYFVLLDI